MDLTLIARESFGFYLEASGPGEQAENTRRKLGGERVEILKRKWSGTLIAPSTAPDRVCSYLGTPELTGATRIGYQLPQRPNYFYTFAFDTAKRLTESGFERISPVAMPASDNTFFNLDDHVAALIAAGATAREVRAGLGEPDVRYGWWPIETWEYAGLVVLTLRHGILESV